ncbi:uncharacterized protein LOC141537207 [Cotesia typhae]|uniref:uncharacterized protein LOC141537207 n=1 Tax=Cotesia typhae TaxID=2053667 RepID=UPI003D680604
MSLFLGKEFNSKVEFEEACKQYQLETGRKFAFSSNYVDTRHLKKTINSKLEIYHCVARCIHHGAPKELKKKVKEPIVRTNCPAYFRMNIHNNETLRIYQWNEEHNCETMPASIASSSSVSQQQKQQQLVSKTMPAKNCQQKRSHEPDSSSGDEFANSPSQSTSRSRCPSKRSDSLYEDISEKDDDGTSVQSPPFSPLSSPVKQPDGNNADATYSLSENSIVFDENLPVIAEDENNEILQVLLGGYFKVSTPEDSLVE